MTNIWHYLINDARYYMLYYVGLKVTEGHV